MPTPWNPFESKGLSELSNLVIVQFVGRSYSVIPLYPRI
jgi:hypothetical protein